MAFNGTGTYVRSFSWASDATNGILVRSDRMDTEDNGFATGLSTTICKDGQSTTTAIIPFALGVKTGDGTVSAPTYTFTSEPSTGLYRVSAGILGVAVSGVNTANFSSANFTTGAHYTVSSATPFMSAGTSTGYFQVSIQNKSNGAGASSDYVCTTDTGTDTTNYIDLGINSSGFTGSGPLNVALDGYLYTQSQNLAIGTVASKNINFVTNNAQVAQFTGAGLFNLGVNGGLNGTMTMNGSTSGTATVKVAAVAGTTNFQLPVGNGTNTYLLQTDGAGVTSWVAPPTSSGQNLLATVNASGVASVVFSSTNLTNASNKYVIEFDGVFTSDSGELYLTISSDNGSTYKSSSYVYSGSNIPFATGTEATAHSSNAAQIPLMTGLQTSATQAGCGAGTIKISSIANALTNIGIIYDVMNIATVSGAMIHGTGSWNGGPAAINNIKIVNSTGGTITGNFHLYSLSGT